MDVNYPPSQALHEIPHGLHVDYTWEVWET